MKVLMHRVRLAGGRCFQKYFVIAAKGLFCAVTMTGVAATVSMAQSIRADGTFSTEVIRSSDNLHFTINEGDRVGDNLFHSFDVFSVPTSGSAVFANPADISNIISRVTGDFSSNIDGLIQASGGANLF